MKHTINMFVVLAVLWWILSGYTYPLLLSLGLASIVFTLFIAHRMDVIDEESHPVHLSFSLLGYWLFLLKEMLLSNVKVLAMIFSPRPDLDPRIVRVDTRQRSDLGRVVLGNSITLTPGTVTIDINGDRLEVHAINEDSARGVEEGVLDKRIPTGLEERD